MAEFNENEFLSAFATKSCLAVAVVDDDEEVVGVDDGGGNPLLLGESNGCVKAACCDEPGAAPEDDEVELLDDVSAEMGEDELHRVEHPLAYPGDDHENCREGSEKRKRGAFL